MLRLLTRNTVSLTESRTVDPVCVGLCVLPLCLSPLFKFVLFCEYTHIYST